MEKKKPNIVFNVVLAVLFLGILVVLGVFYGPELTRLVTNPRQFREYLLGFDNWSFIVFILFQIIQVIIAVIPGEPIQIAGGYIFGTFLGTFLSVIGVMIGYSIVFTAVKLFGYPLVKKLVPQNDLEKFQTLINSPKLEVTIFLLFLIPGVPKDILVYIAGLTPIKPVLFFMIVLIARLPAMIGSAFIGARIESGNYIVVIIVAAAAGILFVIGLIFKDKIIDYIHRKFKNEKKDPPDSGKPLN